MFENFSTKDVKRVTPELVMEAYEETGFKPMNGEFYLVNEVTWEECGCALTVVAEYLNGKGDRMDTTHDACRMFSSLSEDYVQGFIAGFDDAGDYYEGMDLEDPREWKLGYKDGSRCAESVNPTDADTVLEEALLDEEEWEAYLEEM